MLSSVCFKAEADGQDGHAPLNAEFSDRAWTRPLCALDHNTRDPFGADQFRNIIFENTPSQAYFSPNGGCTNAIIHEIENARQEVLVQAFIFTSKEIAKALVDAHKRGVRVEIVLDKGNRLAKHSSGELTARMGIPTYIDAVHMIAHNQIIVIDMETVITGSFSFATSAEDQNAENLLILRSRQLAIQYKENWHKHKGHSEVYERRK